MAEVNLMFYQTVLPSFTHANMFLQKAEPLIHVLQVWLEGLVKSILAKFVKPFVISESCRKGKLSSFNYRDPENHVDDSNLMVGIINRC